MIPHWLVIVLLFGTGIGAFIFLNHTIRRFQEQKRLYQVYWPRYCQDLEKTKHMMTEEQVCAYAAKHYKQIIEEYRARNETRDHYWDRCSTPLDSGYIDWLERNHPAHAQRIRAWYAEPENLFNLAQQTRSRTTPGKEGAERALERTEVPRVARLQYRIRNQELYEKEKEIDPDYAEDATDEEEDE